MFDKTGVKILGLIDNMSFFIVSSPSSKDTAQKIATSNRIAGFREIFI